MRFSGSFGICNQCRCKKLRGADSASLRTKETTQAKGPGLFPSSNRGCDLDVFHRQTDLAGVGLNVEDLDLDRFADWQRFDRLVAQLADVQQAFEPVEDFDEHAEVGHLGDLAIKDGALLQLVRDLVGPWISGELLHAQADALAFAIDLEDQALNDLIFVDLRRWVRELLGPADVVDMQQAFDAWLDLDERTVVGEVLDRAGDLGADWEAILDGFPRIRFCLLHAERDFLLFVIDLEDHHAHFVADLDHFVRMSDLTGPGHLADVDEAFDAVFETNERAVGHQVDDFAAMVRADWVALADIFPRIAGLLFEAEADAVAFGVVIEDHDFDLLTDVHDFRRVRDAAPRHVGDVQQAVETTEVDERTEVGDVLDLAFAQIADMQLFDEVLAVLLALFFEDFAARDDDVLAFNVDLDDFGFDFLADVFADVWGTTQIDLRCRQEHGHADVDEQAALDLAHDATLDAIAFFVAAENLVPTNLKVSLALGEDEVAGGLDLNDHDLDLRPDGGVTEVEFLDRHDAFRLVADIDDDVIVMVANNEAGYDGTRLESIFAGVEAGDEVFLVLSAENALKFTGEENVVDDIDLFWKTHGFITRTCLTGTCSVGLRLATHSNEWQTGLSCAIWCLWTIHKRANA